MHRRVFLQGLFHSVLLLMALPKMAWSAVWSKVVFEAETLAPIYQGLGAGDTHPANPAIRIIAPDKAENGAVVQVEIQAQPALKDISEINLIAEGNPTPLVARFYFTEAMLPRVVTRIKMAQTAALQVLLKNASGWHQQRKTVTVLEDGCASGERDEPFESSMKMRARIVNEGLENIVEIKVIIVHPMRTGRSKNDDGKTLPAHFMQTLVLAHNGQTIFEMQSSTAISKNPYLTVYLKQGKLGDTISASWQDNLGYRGEGKIAVTA